MIKVSSSIALLLTVSLAVSTAVAQGKDEGKKKKELPPSGSLSTSMQTGAVSNKIADIWGGNDTTGENKAPISGSVSRKSADTWIMKVFNNSEDVYSVDLEVAQFNERGSKVKTDAYSYTLKPGEWRERAVTSGVATREAELYLRRYSKHEPKKSKDAKNGASESASAQESPKS